MGSFESAPENCFIVIGVHGFEFRCQSLMAVHFIYLQVTVFRMVGSCGDNSRDVAVRPAYQVCIAEQSRNS